MANLNYAGSCNLLAHTLPNFGITVFMNIHNLAEAEAATLPNTIRLSIGTEHIDDLIADLENGFAAVKE